MRGMRRVLSPIVLAIVLWAPANTAADLDRAAVEFIPPSEIKWVRNAAGTNEQAVLFGDPSKPGPYVVRLKWLPGGKVHYDGAKDEEAIIQVWGMGPATSTPAEKR